MAVNIQLNVYQLNQTVYDRNASIRWGFPTSGLIIKDVSGSPQRSLISGYNVYTALTTTLGDIYYVGETFSAVAALIG